MTYKKREKKCWNQGKKYKGTRKAKEKEYSNQEVKQQLDEQDKGYRYRYYKRTRNMKAHLEYQLRWYQEKLKTTTWNWFKKSCRERIRKIKEKLKKLT